MILPSAGDLQVFRGHAVLCEPGSQEDALGGGVVQQGLGLDPVESHIPERDTHDVAEGGGGEASVVGPRGDPVADAAGLERSSRRGCHGARKSRSSQAIRVSAGASSRVMSRVAEVTAGHSWLRRCHRRWVVGSAGSGAGAAALEVPFLMVVVVPGRLVVVMKNLLAGIPRCGQDAS